MAARPDDRHVRIYEVGPRDGLQNEAVTVPTAAKSRFIDLLADAGLRTIEATSFVSPRAIPQLADADALMAGLDRRGPRQQGSTRSRSSPRRPMRSRPATSA
jgi:hydroxymethylglutaryl-CoA lyase